MASPAIAQQPRVPTISPPPVPVSQPSPRLLQTTLDICIQHITSEKPEYISLYLHPVSYKITSYLIGSIAETSYTLDVALETWKRILEQALNENNLTSKLTHNISTLHNPPKDMYSYVFPLNQYTKVGQIFVPHFPPPFWDKFQRNNNPK